MRVSLLVSGNAANPSFSVTGIQILLTVPTSQSVFEICLVFSSSVIITDANFGIGPATLVGLPPSIVSTTLCSLLTCTLTTPSPPVQCPPGASTQAVLELPGVASSTVEITPHSITTLPACMIGSISDTGCQEVCYSVSQSLSILQLTSLTFQEPSCINSNNFPILVDATVNGKCSSTFFFVKKKPGISLSPLLPQVWTLILCLHNRESESMSLTLAARARLKYAFSSAVPSKSASTDLEALRKLQSQACYSLAPLQMSVVPCLAPLCPRQSHHRAKTFKTA